MYSSTLITFDYQDAKNPFSVIEQFDNQIILNTFITEKNIWLSICFNLPPFTLITKRLVWLSM